MDSNNKLSRRDFLKITGTAGAAAVMVSACGSDKSGNSAV